MKRHTLVLVFFLSGIALSGIWAQDAVLSSGEYPARGQHSYSLYDLYGKLLLQEHILSSPVIVPLDTYAHGMYLLKVSHDTDVIKTFKVIKTN